jgi:hypothetical protein
MILEAGNLALPGCKSQYVTERAPVGPHVGWAWQPGACASKPILYEIEAVVSMRKMYYLASIRY